MPRKRPTTIREWLRDGGTEQEWYDIQRNERGLDRPAPPPWKPVLMLHEREQPDFPVEALPSTFRQFVEAITAAHQTPIDLAATSCLAALSAVMAKKVRVETRIGKTLPVNLFIANITQGTPSERETLREVRGPVHGVEAKKIELSREPIARQQSLRRQEKARLRRLERLGIDSTRSRDEAIELATKIDQNPVPVLPKMIVDDTTPGRIDKILAEQGGRLATFYGEGAILDLFTGSQSKRRMAQRELFRRGHNAESFFVEHRAGLNRTHVKEAAITCHVAVPQSSIEGLQRHRSRRGRGVLDCFLFSMPKKSTAARDRKQRVPFDAKSRYDYEVFVGKYELSKDRFTLAISSGARDVFQLWEDEVEGHLTRHPEEALFRAWLDRLPEQTLRIAAILHMTDLDENGTCAAELSADTLRSAVDIARYFIPHTEAAYAAMHCHWDDATDGARYLLDWFMQDNVKTFTRREAHQRSRARFRQAWEIDGPLNELVRRGYIRPISDDPGEKKTAGRSASQQYEVQTDIYYMHRHPAYPFGEIGQPFVTAETNSEYKPHAPRAHEEQTPNPMVPTLDEAHSNPQESFEHDRRKTADREAASKHSEDKRRKRKYSDAPSVKQFKKKNAHLLKRYREKVVPLLKELEGKVAEEKQAENHG